MENNEQEDYIQLKKNYALRENEWKKDKALYEQKIQLLEIQLEDYRTREMNQKKLNDTITQAIDISGKTQQKSYTEFQKSIEVQMANNKKHQDSISKLEEKLRCLNEQLNEKEIQIKDLELQQQKQQITYDHKIQSLESEKQYLNQEISKYKDQIQKNEENSKSKEQVLKLQCEQEIQKIKDNFFKDMQEKQSDYDQRYQQLAQLYEKEKEQLQQRLIRSQNTIKKYQTHIESNQEVQQLQQKYDEQIAALKQEMHEQQVQFQYEKKMLNKQVDDQRINTNNYDSTSKKKSQDMIKIRNSIASQESPVQCKSFHISQPDFKQVLQQPKNSISSIQKQSLQPPKNNQSFEKIKANNHDTLPMPIEDFNLMMSKKAKSQSTNSLPSNNFNLNSYLQDASIMKEETETGDEFIRFKISNQQTTRFNNEVDQRRSYSQQGTKTHSINSATNLSKMLGQTDQSYQNQTTSISTQQKTHNTSFSHFKVPSFTQGQLNNLKYSLYQQQPQTTLRMNDNHINYIQQIKARYINQDETSQNDSTAIKYVNEIENQQPSKSMHINNEIKFLIGKLLQAKGKLTTELENTQKSCRYKT
ncbi:unnamed protein product (macronuclear) [Paramecium tetraurelia]|uniref:Uncharacterized protein n=1 Tax=Paramecium tetraurelia TaxID=5888 RepID=A0BW09_PARTE|nr:uncharacterized protein GSPATT00032578001 [Paramecium tetraurelia]CAK62726.1 unnamed protein product [Paramecium tetraurelia]|eukprot:XP_001430124.1 hypothetical protein (macronuclear) [Paramecium tetraurelia strain d4-2]